ncbi:MAG: hypothetical protein ACT4OS_04390 [Acidimicrobiales bacterium]
MADGRNFWSSIPGVVTGVAGLTTGLAAILTVSVQAGWLGNDSDDPPSTSTVAGPATTTTTPEDLPGFPTTRRPGLGSPGLGGSAPTFGETENFQVEPELVDFRALGARSATVRVENAGAGTLSLGPVLLEGPQAQSFSVDSTDCLATELVPGRSCELVVTTSAGGLAGRAEATMVISALGGDEVVEVDLEAGGLL